MTAIRFRSRQHSSESVEESSLSAMRAHSMASLAKVEKAERFHEEVPRMLSFRCNAYLKQS